MCRQKEEKKKKKKNIELNGPILQPVKKKKKKPVFILFIYNFFFENLIYKMDKLF